MEETIDQEEAQELPPTNFITFLGDLVTTGQLYLEGIRNPETDEVIIDLGLVKRIIDSIEMLEEKTKGNLTAPEANFLSNTLYELRMGYIRAVSRQEAAAQAETTAEEPEVEPSDNTTEAEVPADKTEEAS
ncbi:DUF1844 domain-containing protein [Candidatus Poribacteria bacterium]|nr:DUF1844 domain-containing protein [Candidatus Poribacteria bacterium]MYB01136.1 DUF1844 domain-containing protein [Candidatus Poribacteria bacterium]